MNAVLFAPHNDDETLFATWQLLRHDPHVVIVLKSAKQSDLGVTAETREAETDCALKQLGVSSWEQWPYPDTGPDWQAVELAMQMLDERMEPELVLAPAVEDGGHEQHSRVGELARAVFGDRVTAYLTYVRGQLSSRVGEEVAFEPDWPVRKLRALACYESQIGLPATRPWFMDDTLREWVAA